MPIFILQALSFAADQPGLNRAPTHFSISPDGNFFLFSVENQKGFYLFDKIENRSFLLPPGSDGTYVNWGFNGKRLGFKQIISTGESGPFQIPVVLDLATRKVVALHDGASLVGIPSFSQSGRIAVTIGNQVRILRPNLSLEFSLDLGHYVNLARISPDGRWLAWNNRNDQIMITDLDTRQTSLISDHRQGYYNPIWSPQSNALIYQGFNETIYYYELSSKKSRVLDEGAHPVWSPDGKRIFYARPQWGENGFLKNRDIWVTDLSTGRHQNLTPTPEQFEDYPNWGGREQKLYLTSDNQLEFQHLSFQYQNQGLQVVASGVMKIHPDNPIQIHPLSLPVPGPRKLEKTTSQSFPAPYIHQVFDTPNWFNGHWACGATSAMMGLCYFQVLPAWNTIVNWPYPHTSSHGRYICEIYSFQGYTYDIGTKDPNGNLGYGGYGFITQNNWSDTKGNMAKYLRQHGLGSMVDWEPTWSKAKREVGQLFPFVLLNSLTNAGHYILVVGYKDPQHSLIVNDPYGNKNLGYMNYKGRNAVYDLPGYNNGNENLNTVWCYIYLHAAVDLASGRFLIADTLSIGDSLKFTATVINNGKKASPEEIVSVMLSRNNIIDQNDRILTEFTIPPLDPGAQLNLDVSIQIPFDQVSKKYAIAVWVDKENQIIEANEENNIHWEPIIIRGLPRIVRVTPADKSELHSDSVRVQAFFSDPICGIRTDSVHLSLNGQDFTGQAEVSPNSILWNGYLSPGDYEAKATAVNNDGHQAYRIWHFKVATSADVAFNPDSPASFQLYPIYPNPFRNGSGKNLCFISFSLSDPGEVRFTVYNLIGKPVWDFQKIIASRGRHTINWDGKDEFGNFLPSGVYWIVIHAKHRFRTQKLLLLK